MTSSKTHIYSPWRVLAMCQVSHFFLGVASKIEVQSFSVFPTWLPHHVTYDVIIINKTFHMRSRSDGEKFVSIKRAVSAKNTKVLCRQTDKQTNKRTQNAKPSPSVRELTWIQIFNVGINLCLNCDLRTWYRWKWIRTFTSHCISSCRCGGKCVSACVCVWCDWRLLFGKIKTTPLTT